MGKQNKFFLSFRNRKGLLIIITAALLLELLSAAQYLFTRNMMEVELEKRAEGELTLKAILIKNSLNSSEDILKNHLWDIRENLSHPDSVIEAIERMIMLSRHVVGGGVGFVPNYYPQKGKLFEPYALKKDGSIERDQIGGADHDYTTGEPYKQALAADDAVWIEPYEDQKGAQTSVITYIMPLYDKTKTLAGAAGVDVSLDELRDTIDNRHLFPSSFVLLLSESGKPIIRPSEDRVSKEASDYIISIVNNGQDPTIDGPPKKSRSGRSKVLHFDTNKRDGMVFYANMKGEPHWQLAVVCYDDEAFAPLKQLRLRMILLMLLAFGILLYMIYRYARNEEKLQQKTKEQERIDNELKIASGIQQALLPAHEPTLADINDVSVEGKLIPAKTVGGDLYNAFVRDGKLFFCIGDVSGKGIPSALIMAITQSLFHNIALRNNNPAHIMDQLNEMACRNNKSNMFATMFVGVLDLSTGHLCYCNAGHEVPVLLSEGEKCQFLDAKANLPIGLFDDFRYEMQEMDMVKGSTLFLYTDGLTEARNAQNKQYGRNHVVQMLDEWGITEPQKLVETVVSEVNHYSENTEQTDDLTLLAIKLIIDN